MRALRVLVLRRNEQVSEQKQLRAEMKKRAVVRRVKLLSQRIGRKSMREQEIEQLTH